MKSPQHQYLGQNIKSTTYQMSKSQKEKFFKSSTNNSNTKGTDHLNLSSDKNTNN